MPRSSVRNRVLWVGVAALLLSTVAFGGTVLYLALRPARTPAETSSAEQTSDRHSRDLTLRPVVPTSLTTIEIPDESERLLSWRWKRYRPPRQRWTAQDVERFWLDPGGIGAEYLSQTNRRLIQELLQGVP